MQIIKTTQQIDRFVFDFLTEDRFHKKCENITY